MRYKSIAKPIIDNLLHVIAIVASVFLLGCSTIDYNKYSKSNASVENLIVEVSGTPYTGKHQITAKFDYHINHFHDLSGLYFCDIFLKEKKSQRIIMVYKKSHTCSINSASGTISLKRDTPLSTTGRYKKEHLNNMVLPLKFHVVIRQKTADKRSSIIGKSEPLFLGHKT